MRDESFSFLFGTVLTISYPLLIECRYVIIMSSSSKSKIRLSNSNTKSPIAISTPALIAVSMP